MILSRFLVKGWSVENPNDQVPIPKQGVTAFLGFGHWDLLVARQAILSLPIPATKM
jgi:hypothetical protein